MFKAINKNMGITIVIVTHDRMLAKKVNRVVAIRDGKTNSEKSYADKMTSLEGFDGVESPAETQEEFAVLDRVGRVQIPKEYLEKIGVQRNKIKMELNQGRIILSPPQDSL